MCCIDYKYMDIGQWILDRNIGHFCVSIQEIVAYYDVYCVPIHINDLTVNTFNSDFKL